MSNEGAGVVPRADSLQHMSRKERKRLLARRRAVGVEYLQEHMFDLAVTRPMGIPLDVVLEGLIPFCDWVTTRTLAKLFIRVDMTIGSADGSFWKHLFETQFRTHPKWLHAIKRGLAVTKAFPRRYQDIMEYLLTTTDVSKAVAANETDEVERMYERVQAVQTSSGVSSHGQATAASVPPPSRPPVVQKQKVTDLSAVECLHLFVDAFGEMFSEDQLQCSHDSSRFTTSLCECLECNISVSIASCQNMYDAAVERRCVNAAARRATCLTPLQCIATVLATHSSAFSPMQLRCKHPRVSDEAGLVSCHTCGVEVFREQAQRLSDWYCSD